MVKYLSIAIGQIKPRQLINFFMETEQQLKKLIEKSSFLAYDEKGALLAKLSSLNAEKKKKLYEFLLLEAAKFSTISLKYAAVFQTVYTKWQNTFDKISKLIL